jgi:hypothetical protein
VLRYKNTDSENIYRGTVLKPIPVFDPIYQQEREDYFDLCLMRASMRTNYDYLDIRFLTYKKENRQIMAMADQTLIDVKNGRIKPDNKISIFLRDYEQRYIEWKALFTGWCIEEKVTTKEDAKWFMGQYLEKRLPETLMPLGDGAVRKWIDKDVTKEKALGVNPYKRSESDVTEVTGIAYNRARAIVDNMMDKQMPYKDARREAIDHDGVEFKEACRKDVNRQFKELRWFVFGDYLMDRVTSFDNELTEHQLEVIKEHLDVAEIHDFPRILEQKILPIKGMTVEVTKIPKQREDQPKLVARN